MASDDYAVDDTIPLATAIPIDDNAAELLASSTLSPPGSSTNPLHNSNSNPPLIVRQLSTLALQSSQVTCPHCQQDVRTRIQRKVDLFTFIAMGILFLLCWPLCWLPLVLPGCKVTEHICPMCHHKVRSLNGYDFWKVFVRNGGVRIPPLKQFFFFFFFFFFPISL
jgi:hypothetical protein